MNNESLAKNFRRGIFSYQNVVDKIGREKTKSLLGTYKEAINSSCGPKNRLKQIASEIEAAQQNPEDAVFFVQMNSLELREFAEAFFE